MKTFNVCAGALAVALATTALPFSAWAGECPEDQVGTNELKDYPTKPKGVSDEVIGSIDLGPELGVNGNDLRLRRLIVQPGGVVPFHSHHGRPAIIYTVRGYIYEYASNCRVPMMHHAGEAVQETANVSHYWVNKGKSVVEILSADVKPREMDAKDHE